MLTEMSKLSKNEKEKRLLKSEEVWDGVAMCDCSDPICDCSPEKSEITALRYALYSYWAGHKKPLSKFMIPEFKKQYGNWKQKHSWRNFVMDVFSHNNLKALEIIDAYELN